MLKLEQADYEAIRRHGEETYPQECCGVLLGRFDDDGTRVVMSTARCGNTRTDSAHNRYNIDPRELVKFQREGRERGEDIIGFYHSHPDHPAQWSQTDHAEAHWLGCSYIITSVEKRNAVVRLLRLICRSVGLNWLQDSKAAITNSFELVGSNEDDKRLVNEVIDVAENPGSRA